MQPIPTLFECAFPHCRNTKVQDDGPVVKSSIADKKSVVKMDPVKDFGSFSLLMAPALISGKKSSSEVDHHNDTNNGGDMLFSNNNNINNKSVIEKESTSYNFENSNLNTTYSTTLNTQVKNSTNGFKEESFLIKSEGLGRYGSLGMESGKLHYF